MHTRLLAIFLMRTVDAPTWMQDQKHADSEVGAAGQRPGFEVGTPERSRGGIRDRGRVRPMPRLRNGRWCSSGRSLRDARMGTCSLMNPQFTIIYIMRN